MKIVIFNKPGIRLSGAVTFVAVSRFSSLSGAFVCLHKKAYRPDGSASGPFFCPDKRLTKPRKNL
jgi:hypothetical protein